MGKITIDSLLSLETITRSALPFVKKQLPSAAYALFILAIT